MHERRVRREEAGGAIVRGADHGGHHLRGPTHPPVSHHATWQPRNHLSQPLLHHCPDATSAPPPPRPRLIQHEPFSHEHWSDDDELGFPN